MQILIWNSLIQGFAVGIIWVPLSVVAFDTLAPSDRAEAAAVFHLLAQHRLELLHLAVDRRDRARDGRQLQPHDRDDLALQHDAVAAVGDGRVERRQRCAGLGARLAKEIGRQAAMIGYLNAFMMYTIASALAVALVLIVRRRAKALDPT